MGYNQTANTLLIGSSGVSSGSRANFGINAAYNHLVSGTALSYRFRAQKAGALQEFYAFLDATTGTRANISLRCRVYEANNAASNLRPSGTLIATATDASLPASDDRWIRWEFPTPPTLTFNQVYWLVIDNLASAPATDFPGILSGLSFRTSGRIPNTETVLAGYSTSTGFTTNGSGQHATVVYVVDGQSFGNPFTLAQSAYTSNQLRHGALFANDLAKFKYWTFQSDGIAGTANLFEVHDAALAPGSGVLYSSAIPTATIESTSGGLLFSPLLDVSGSGEFIISVRSTSNTASPGCFVIEGYADYPTVFDQFFDGFTCCKAIQELAGVWTLVPGAAARTCLVAQEFKSSSSTPPATLRGYVS